MIVFVCVCARAFLSSPICPGSLVCRSDSECMCGWERLFFFGKWPPGEDLGLFFRSNRSVFLDMTQFGFPGYDPISNEGCSHERSGRWQFLNKVV